MKISRLTVSIKPHVSLHGVTELNVEVVSDKAFYEYIKMLPHGDDIDSMFDTMMDEAKIQIKKAAKKSIQTKNSK